MARSSRSAREIAVFRDGKQIDTMYPGRSIFRKHEDEEARTDVAIRRSIAEDLYLVLAAGLRPRHADDQPAGGGESAGQLDLARLRRAGVRHRHRAAARAGVFVRGGQAAGGGGDDRDDAFLRSCWPACSAWHLAFTRRPTSSRSERRDSRRSSNALEEQLRHEMGCICGTCAHEPLSKCTCGTAQKMRADLRAQIDQGKNRDEIIDRASSACYGGQHFLTAPLDRGFNRLAWIVPYALAGAGIVLGRLRRDALVARGRDRRPGGGTVRRRVDIPSSKNVSTMSSGTSTERAGPC